MFAYQDWVLFPLLWPWQLLFALLWCWQELFGLLPTAGCCAGIAVAAGRKMMFHATE